MENLIKVEVEILMYAFQYCLKKYKNTPGMLFRNLWKNKEKLQGEQLDCILRLIDLKNEKRCKDKILEKILYDKYRKETAYQFILSGEDIYWIQFRELIADEQRGLII